MKNYKYIFKILITFLSIIIIYQTSILYLGGSKFPDFSYKNLKNKIIKGSSLPKMKTLIIFFSTDCNYCTDLINEVKMVAKKRKDLNFLFVTEEKNKSLVNLYVKENEIDKLSSYILLDSQNTFQKDFGLGFALSIPTILYYDNEGNFVKEIKDYDELLSL